MKLNIYKNQNEVEKTYETEAYDLMYGTVEDLFEVMDDVSDTSSEMEILKAVQKHRHKLNRLLKDVFPEITDEELKHVKLKELVPFFIDLFAFVQKSFGSEKN